MAITLFASSESFYIELSESKNSRFSFTKGKNMKGMLCLLKNTRICSALLNSYQRCCIATMLCFGKIK